MGTPIHRKMREVQFAAGGRQIAPTFPLIGTPIRWERHCIWWERPLDSRERTIVSQERPIVLWNPVLWNTVYPKSWILKIPLLRETEHSRPGVYFDTEYVSAHFCRTKTPWIAIWGKIFCFVRKSSLPGIIFIENWNSLMFASFPKRYFVFGVVFRNELSPKAVQPEVPGVRRDPKANLEVCCHEATFPFTVKCWKVDFPMPSRTKPC